MKKLPVHETVVVYFSTTQFAVLTLIPRLKQRWPDAIVVVDYQDPWFSDFYRQHSEIRPPGGRLKYAVVNRLAQYHEPRTLHCVDGLTAVSAAYLKTLRNRYRWVSQIPMRTLPFAVAETDFDALKLHPPADPVFQRSPAALNWVYVGRGGADMESACRALFRAFHRNLKRIPELKRVHMHFIGTDYAPPGRARPTIAPIADQEGVAAMVSEYPERVSYGTALQALVDADALIIPGSIDPSYSASKIFPCIVARKPLLAIFHEQSPIHEIVASTSSGICIPFSSPTTIDQLSEAIEAQWLSQNAFLNTPSTNWCAFSPYTAKQMTKELSVFFDEVVLRAATEKP